MAILAFDMDNTFTNTSARVNIEATKAAHDLDREDVLDFLAKTILPVCKYPDWVSKFIYDNVIVKRTYMDVVEETGLFKGIKEVIGIAKEFRKDLKSVICTHRGNNTSAWMSTYNWLNKKGMIETNKIDMIHSISHIEQKNKIEYLRSMYPGEVILLLDDNPFGSTTTVHEFSKEVLIYDKIDKFDGYVNQDVFTDHKDLLKRIINM
jgi:hypothetical protein